MSTSTRRAEARGPNGRAAPLKVPSVALLLALTFAFAFSLAVPMAPTARAADKADGGGYRYWSFWLQKDGGDGWSYATEGPATQRPEDGETLGFRFALSEDSRNAKKPRGAAEFAAACADTPEKPGSKRVALRLDFGTRSDAPENGADRSDGADGSDGADRADGAPPKARTECASVEEKASAADALAAVAKPLRYSSDSLLCAIDGYPAKGCGEQVADSGDTGKAEGSSTAKGKGSNADSDGGGGGGGNGDSRGDGGTMSTGLGVGAGIAVVAVLGAAALWQARRRKH